MMFKPCLNQSLDMNTSVSVIYYTSKTLKNGNHPLMLRVTQNRKVKYISLGISIAPEHWDTQKNCPKKICPNRSSISRLITEKTKEYTDKILELQIEKKDFTARSLIDTLQNPNKRLTVKELFLYQIEQLKQEDRIHYAQSYQQTYNSMLQYNKHLDIYFSDIDVTWLKGFEVYLRKKGLAANTIGIRFRNLRAIYNIAINEQHVKQEHYPFKTFHVSKFNEVTPKRAIRKEEIVPVIQKECAMSPSPYKQLAIDLFAFSYLTAGINFTDMARIKRENLFDNSLVYKRKKTKKLIRVPLQPKAMEIINKYKSNDNPYIFPILSPFHKTEQQKLNRIHKVIGKVNACLKSLGTELNLDKKLTTYVARHSYATVLKRAGVSTSIISETLGHSSEKVTKIYLDSFDNEQMNSAMQNLL